MTLKQELRVLPPRTVPPSRKSIRIGGFSLVYRPLAVSVCIALAVALFLLLCINIGRGDYPISIPPDVISVLLGNGSKTQNLIVFDLRLPRSLTALFIGMALGIAGAVTQTIARTPSPAPTSSESRPDRVLPRLLSSCSAVAGRSWDCLPHWGGFRWLHCVAVC